MGVIACADKMGLEVFHFRPRVDRPTMTKGISEQDATRLILSYLRQGFPLPVPESKWDWRTVPGFSDGTYRVVERAVADALSSWEQVVYARNGGTNSR